MEARRLHPFPGKYILKIFLLLGKDVTVSEMWQRIMDKWRNCLFVCLTVVMFGL